MIASLFVAGVLGGGIVIARRTNDRRSTEPRASATHGSSARAFRSGGNGPIVPDARNAATPARAAQAVGESLRTAPERLSTTAALPPFDRRAFEANPAAYLAQVEPARCTQTAEPGEGVPVLEVQSQARAAIQNGEVTPLWVKGVPGAPVTFTTFDGGLFQENGLPSVTVQANANGLAVAHFTAGRGIGGDVTILAGSPMSSGTQRFFIRVGGQQPWASAEPGRSMARPPGGPGSPRGELP